MGDEGEDLGWWSSEGLIEEQFTWTLLHITPFISLFKYVSCNETVDLQWNYDYTCIYKIKRTPLLRMVHGTVLISYDKIW